MRRVLIERVECDFPIKSLKKNTQPYILKIGSLSHKITEILPLRIMIIPTPKIVELTTQHVFESPSYHFREEDKIVSSSLPEWSLGY